MKLTLRDGMSFNGALRKHYVRLATIPAQEYGYSRLYAG